MGRTQTTNEPALLQSISSDSRHVISIVERGGYYRFIEERLMHQPREGVVDAYEYWCESYRSGVYATIDAAKVAAELENTQTNWTHY